MALSDEVRHRLARAFGTSMNEQAAAAELVDAVNAASGGGGAALDLSNLTSPTAINQSLLPSTSGLDIGSIGQPWHNIYLTNVTSGSPGTLWTSKIATTGGHGLLLQGNGSADIHITVNTIHLEGPVLLNAAMDAGGQQINDMADPTSPQDAATMAYVLANAGGANITLSNLSVSPVTAVNADIIPAADNNINLGAPGFAYSNLFAYLLGGGTGGTTVNLNLGIASDISAAHSLDWNLRQLFDSTGVASVNWSARTLTDSVNAGQLAWSTVGVEINTALILDGATSGAITLEAAATTTPYTITMPAAQGATGSVLTDSDGAGTLTWASPAVSSMQASTAASSYALVPHTQLLAFTSSFQATGAAALTTVPGLLATDTIIAVTQKTVGSAATQPIVGWTAQIDGFLTITYVADAGGASVVIVLVMR
jgi:hypothetical protein